MVFAITESSRYITLLSSDSKIQRKESLTAIEKDLKENLAHTDKAEQLSHFSWIIPKLVNLLSDPIESHREKSLSILSQLCEHIENTECFIPHLTQVLVKRLATKDSIEESEEIRLLSLKLLLSVLQKLGNGSSCVDDCCLAMQFSLADSFHDIKVICCEILKLISSKFSSLFYHVAEPVLKPLLSNITHQQHKVRVATVKCIGVVFEHCNGKFVDLTIAPLTQRLFDPSIAVRKAVVDVVGEWLLNLNDRYSYHTKLIPLILSGQIDEVEEIRSEAAALWDDVGLKYQKENEKDLKDQIDFDPGTPSHYPPDQVRPNFGCRELVCRSASRLIGGLVGDLGDWQESTRRQAAALLRLLILHLENRTTQHTAVLIPGLANAAAAALMSLPSLQRILLSQSQQEAPRSPEEALLQNVFASAKLTAYFVDTPIWWKLLFENARRCMESTSPCSLAANYFVLANLLSGSSPDRLIASPSSDSGSAGPAPSCCVLLRVCAFLSADEQVSCASFAAKAGLLECANSLVSIIDAILRQLEMTPKGDSTERQHLEEVASVALEDTFFLLIAISASWREGQERTEFAEDFNDQVGNLLCALSRHQSVLLHERDDHSTGSAPHGEGADRETRLIFEAKMAGQMLERLYGHQLPKLLKRLNAKRLSRRDGAWHAKSTELCIFVHAVLAAGPGLLLGAEPTGCLNCGTHETNNPPSVAKIDDDVSALGLTLRMLEQGCRLGEPLNTNKPDDKSAPLSLAAEAELHLKGLLLLVRLTEHARVRLVLTQPRLFRHCLERLVLPSCEWRAGRTAEAMRKAAVTSLVALLASVVPLCPPNRKAGSKPLPGRKVSDCRLDQCLEERIELTRGLLKELEAKNGLLSHRVRLVEPPPPASGNISDTARLANLGLVSAASPRLLSSLLTRLGALLTDEALETRLLTCTALTLFFSGIYTGGSEEAVGETASKSGSYIPGAFIRSPAWFLPLKPDDKGGVGEIDFESSGEKMPGLTTPLPGSLGDQVYRFYPNLVKALDDASDEVRLRVADVFVTWFWVMTPNLINRPPPVPLSGSKEATESTDKPGDLNSVYSAVIKDLVSTVAVHLDDPSCVIRAAVARVILRAAKVAPEIVKSVLTSAAERHRSPELCRALVESLEQKVDDSKKEAT